MRWAIVAIVFCSLTLAPTSGLAQTLATVKSDISRVLAEMEGNLVTGEAISMNLKDWRGRADSAKVRFDDLDRRFDELNAYCRGTFEHDEYVRRLAHCESVGAQLETLKTQLNLDLANVAAEFETLKAREETRLTQYRALEATLSAGLPKLIDVCTGLAAAERSGCRMPPAPGPRTASIVNEWNTTLTSLFAP